MLQLKHNKRLIGIVTLLLFCSIPILYSLFLPGFFLSDDGEWMIIRFSAFYEALRDGQFPVRFLHRLNFGYGYPVSNFLYPGFLYFGIPFHVIGFGYVDTIKIIIGISFFGSALFTFLWLSKLFGVVPSFVGALLYIYFPYHLYDLYIRGSVGEIFAMLWIPFILWNFEKQNILFSSFGIAMLLLSHNTLAVLYFPILFFYLVIRMVPTTKMKKIFIFLPFFYGILLTSFFWIPALYDLRYTVFSNTIVSHISSYFPSVSLIGIISFIILGIACILLCVSSIKKTFLFYYFLCISFFAMFALFPLSEFIWKILPIQFIQFPFRVLAVTNLSFIFLSAFIIHVFSFKKKIAIVLGVFFIGVTIFSSKEYFYPKERFDKSDGYYATNQDTTTVKNEYMPIWVKDYPSQWPIPKIAIDDGTIHSQKISNKEISFVVDSPKDTMATIHTIYFPGWNAYINNKPVEIVFSNEKGIMQVLIPKGYSRVSVLFEETPIRWFANMISFTTFVGMVVYYGIRKIKR